VSLPIGAFSVPLQDVVQLTTVGVPALPPLGVTVTDADLVDAETYAGRSEPVFGCGITIVNATLVVCGARGACDALGAGRVDVLLPALHDASNAAAATVAQRRNNVLIMILRTAWW
jgi:hypothetical protein